MAERSLGSLVYWMRIKNDELKRKADESGKAIQDMSKKFDDSKRTIKSWSADVKNSIKQVSDFAKQHKEAIQAVAVGTGAALAGLALEVKKATKEYVEFKNAMIGLRSIAEGTGQDLEKTTKAAQDLAADGLMSIADAATGLKNLLLAGFGLDEAIILMERFKDSAAFGRQGALSFGQAIVSATEGIKNGNSILVDNAGVTKNLSVMLQEAGYSARDLMHAADDAGVRMAIFNGIIRETRHQVGDAAKLAAELGGAQSRVEESTKRLHRAIGAAVEGPIRSYLTALDKILNKTAQWIEDNQELTSGIVFGLGGVLAAILSLSTGLLVLDKLVNVLRLIRTLALENALAFSIRSWISGAASATEAIGFLFGALKPFLVGGAVVVGVAAIAAAFYQMYQNAKLAKKEISEISDLQEALAKQRQLEEERDRIRRQIENRRFLEQRAAEGGPQAAYAKTALEGGSFGYGMKTKGMPSIEDLNAQLDETEKQLGEINEKIKKLQEDAGVIYEPPEYTYEPPKFNLDEFIDQLQKELETIDRVAETFGDTSDVAKDKANALRRAIVTLVEEGIDPTNTAMGNLVEMHREYSQAAEDAKKETYDLSKAETELRKALADIDKQAEVFGDTVDANAQKLKLYQDTIIEALVNDEPIENIQDLIDEYNALKEEIDAATTAEQNNKAATDMLTQAQEYLYRMTGKLAPEWERFAQKLEEAAGKEGVLPEVAAELIRLAKEIRDAGEEAITVFGIKFPASVIEGFEKARRTIQEWYDFFSKIMNGIQAIYSQAYRNREIELENWYKKEKKVIEESKKSEEEKKEALEKLENEYDQYKREIMRRQAVAEKNSAIFSIIINTARAVVEALPNVFLSALIGIMGLEQLRLVQEQPLPELKEGGLAVRSVAAIIGEGRDDEAILPLNESVFARIAEGILNQLAKLKYPTVQLATPEGLVVPEPQVVYQFNNTFRIGTLIGNKEGYRELSREIYPYIKGEEKRRGEA